VISVGQLCQLLGEVRRNAVAVSRGQHQPGKASVAAPVFGPAAEVVGAVEVVLRQDADLRGLLPVVTRTAYELSQGLAATEPRRRRPLQVGHVVHPVEIPERRY
jgi:DNA-binding IclR family transcriptional regulator